MEEETPCYLSERFAISAQILRLQRMTGLVKLHRSARHCREGPQRSVDRNRHPMHHLKITTGAEMTNSITQDDRALLLAEYQPLREEVNRTVDRMTANELACSAFVFSIILFQFSAKNVTSIPDWIVIPFGASLALVVAFLGYERSRVFRRHMDQVDDYLADIERALSSQFGWTNHYRDTCISSDFI